MFKAIKEFFVGKPKVEEAPAECPYKAEAAPVPEPTPEPVVVVEPTPAPALVVEEIKPETVTISVSDNMNVSVSSQPDTITLTPPVDPGAWPFPNTPPAETAVKKKRTFVKREEPVADKKPTPAIKVNKNKPRKKK